jgi:hypothetical protein
MRCFSALVLLLLIPFAASKLAADVSSVRYYGEGGYYGSLGPQIYESGTTVQYYYSTSSPSLTVDLYRLNPDELPDYDFKTSFRELVDRQTFRTAGKLERELLSSDYDPVTKKHHRTYHWVRHYYLSGSVTKKLDKGIYAFVSNDRPQIYVVSDLSVISKYTESERYLMLLDSKTGQLRDGEFTFFLGSSIVKRMSTKDGVVSCGDLDFDSFHVKTADVELYSETGYQYGSYKSSYYYNPSNEIETITDRPVYRPNQTVFFKGIYWTTVES